MASFKAKFPVLQELFAKKHRGALCPPPPAGRGLNVVEGRVWHQFLFERARLDILTAFVGSVPMEGCF